MFAKNLSRARRLAFLAALTFLVGSFLLLKPAFATTPFAPETVFATPTGTIMFLHGGGYEVARLDDGSWYFQGLVSNDCNSNASQNVIVQDSPFTEDSDPWVLSLNNGSLRVSLVDANVTVGNYDLITAMIHIGWLNYTVQGKGSQTWNFYYNGSVPPVSWSVMIDGVTRAQNDGWQVNEDGSLTVTGATSDVGIRYEQTALIQEPPLPWSFQQYLIFSVGVGSAVAVAVCLSIVFMGGRRRKGKQMRLE